MQEKLFKITILLNLILIGFVIPVYGIGINDTLDSWIKLIEETIGSDLLSIQQTSDLGYIAAGYINVPSEHGRDVWVIKLDASGNQIWNKTYGGASVDEARQIMEVSGGGYLVICYTMSFGAGSADAWVLKLDSSGEQEWSKTFGGKDADEIYHIQQTTDGGYIAAGGTRSSGMGGGDFWILKLNNNGEKEWEKTFGGKKRDRASHIKQTIDEGYIVAGGTISYGSGNYDFWVLKLDANGNEIWQKTFGGQSFDWANFVQQTSDGRYVIAGGTRSFGAGMNDLWVLGLDSSGNMTWEKTYGGMYLDEAKSFNKTNDGGYIVAGISSSFGIGGYDYWVLKLDSLGDQQWSKTFGGMRLDYARAISQTSDGGYIVLGSTEFNGSWPRKHEIWLFKLDKNGNSNWCQFNCCSRGDCGDNDINCIYTGETETQCANCSSYNYCQRDPICRDNTCVKSCISRCHKDDIPWLSSACQRQEDVHQHGITQTCLGENCGQKASTWAKMFGGKCYDIATSIQQTHDKEYIIAGTTMSYGNGTKDILLLKLNSSGEQVDAITYGGTYEESAFSMQRTTEGGYVIAG
ncbi:MAG: hypothetical protein AB1546_04205, partial [bacterium]